MNSSAVQFLGLVLFLLSFLIEHNVYTSRDLSAITPPPYLVYRDKLIADGTSQDEDLDGNRSSLRTGLMFSKFINVNLQLRIRWSTPRIPSQRLPFGRFSKMPRLMLKDAISEGLKVFSPLPAGKQLLNLASDVFELSVGHYTIALYSRRRRR